MTLIRIARWGVPLLLIAALVSQRKVVAAATVQWSGFEKLDACYFAPSFTGSSRAAIHQHWVDARQRVAGFYGPLRAQPRIVVADADTYPRFAAGTTGARHYLATGAAITILGPPGHNIDVISHELAHAELIARIGFRAITWCVPTWFDEGLAVQFDERPEFTEQVYFERLAAGWHMPPLTQLDTASSFFAGTRDEVRFHYAGARVAISHWLRSMSPAAAKSSIDSIDCSASWQARFGRIASSLPPTSP